METCIHGDIYIEKEMATHSSIFAWRIPGTEEPSGLPSMGSHRVRHDWSKLAVTATYMSEKRLALSLHKKTIAA